MGRPRKYTKQLQPGVKFGSWTISGDITTAGGRTTVTATCSCGTVSEVHAYDLVNGRSTQCKQCAQGTSPSYGAVNSKLNRVASIRGVNYALSPQVISESLSQQSGTCALSGVTLTPENTSVLCVSNSEGLTPQNTVYVSTEVKKAIGALDLNTMINYVQTYTAQIPKPKVSTEDFFNRREESDDSHE